LIYRVDCASAVGGSAIIKLSYYDAQIWASARLNQVPRPDEGFPHGSVLEECVS